MGSTPQDGMGVFVGALLETGHANPAHKEYFGKRVTGRCEANIIPCPDWTGIALRALLPQYLFDRTFFLDEWFEGTRCWGYQGRLNRNGYRRCWWEGRDTVAHRATYTVFFGSIPGNTPIIDHRCRNRGCCNPRHLEPVTHSMNTRRGHAVLFTRIF